MDEIKLERKADNSFKWEEFVAGALAGATGFVFGHPFDTTKVQLQTQQAKGSSTLKAVSNVHKVGWRRGFFRGLSLPLATSVVINCSMYGVYGNSVEHISRWRDEPASKPPADSDGLSTICRASATTVFAAGCVAGLAQLLPASPADVVKVVLQSQIVDGDGPKKRFFHGPADCARAIYKRYGIAGFYKGLSVVVHRDVWATGVYYLAYEWMFSRLQWVLSKYQLDRNGLFSSLLSGGCAGVLSWASIIPLDVIKSRYQADFGYKRYRSVRDCVRSSYQRHGLGIFFKGFKVTCLRAFPVNAIIFSTYHMSVEQLRALRSH